MLSASSVTVAISIPTLSGDIRVRGSLSTLEASFDFQVEQPNTHIVATSVNVRYRFMTFPAENSRDDNSEASTGQGKLGF